MRVVISIAEHELEMAHRWFDWVSELSGTEGHSLTIIPGEGVMIKDILPKAQAAFNDKVMILRDYEEEKSDWQNTDPMRSAAGPNSSFRQVAWDAFMNKRGHYFWCECDCIPLTKHWLTWLENEYQIARAEGKPFVGAHVQIENVPEHMSGNAIYPDNIPELAPTLVQRTEWTPKGQTRNFELAFDIAGAQEVLPQAYWTNLIQHKFRYEGFKSREQFDAVINPQAVVFHSCKDGSIYKYLRENLSGGVESRHQQTRSTVDLDGAPDPRFSAASSSGSSAPPAQTNLSDGLSGGHGVADVIQSTPPAQDNSDWNYAIPKVANRTYVSSDELENVIVQNQFIKRGIPPMSAPWENREDSEHDVKMLCNVLSLFCKTTVYKGRVRKALREAKIIK